MTAASTRPAIDLSVVVPVFNELPNLPRLHAELTAVLDGLGRTCEILYVDDGSTDGSGEWLADVARSDPRVVLIQFRRNFGQTPALSAAFDHARGQVVVTLDADLQNDPADIPRLLAKLDEGYDVVSGWRRKRHDPYWSRVLPSRLANRLVSRLTGVRLHDHGCTLKAYRHEVVANVSLSGEMHRFIPAVCHWMGVRVAELEVAHRPRLHGVSHYGLARASTVLLDVINIKFLLSYYTRPIQVFGSLGLLSILASLIVGTVVVGLKLAVQFDMTGNPLFMGAILLFLLGVQFIVLGLITEIVVRVYQEAPGRRTYVVKQIIRDGENISVPLPKRVG